MNFYLLFALLVWWIFTENVLAENLRRDLQEAYIGFNELLVIKKEYEHYVGINTEVRVSNSENYSTKMVYYINCFVNPNYFDWILGHVPKVLNYESSKLYIIANIAKSEESKFRYDITKLYPNVTVECHYDQHEYEYRGILKVWELGQIHHSRNDIILYFHSKGVTRTDKFTKVGGEHNAILEDFNRIKEIFSIFPSIDKIGLQAGGNGWIWCNFWFARGSYIVANEKPILTKRRHYYEDWLGRQLLTGRDSVHPIEERSGIYKNTIRSCYQFYTDKVKIGNIGGYLNPNIGDYEALSASRN